MTKPYKNKFDRAVHDVDWEGDDDGYEYSQPGKRLRRNKIDGVVGGVCAGIGDYIGIDPVMVRIAYIASMVFAGVPLFIYFICWIFIPADNRAPYRREYRQARKARKKARREARRNEYDEPVRPMNTTTFRDVKGKFRSLETRLQDMERSITSSEWQLRREFRDLES